MNSAGTENKWTPFGEQEKNQLINVKTGRLPSPIGIRIFRLSSILCADWRRSPPPDVDRFDRVSWMHSVHTATIKCAHIPSHGAPLKVQSGWYGKWMTQFWWVGERWKERAARFMRVCDCDASLCHGFWRIGTTRRLDRMAERSKKLPADENAATFLWLWEFFFALPWCRLLIMRFNRSFIIVGCLLL